MNAALLRRLRFSHKIGLLSLVAGLSFLLVFLLADHSRKTTDRLLTEIETGYLPAFDLSRNLEDRFHLIQRTLQDAASAADPSRLPQADQMNDKVLELLDKTKANPVVSN